MKEEYLGNNMKEYRKIEHLPDVNNIMREFFNIVAPGHDKPKGYINVTKLVEKLGVDRRTYYHWRNGEAVPSVDKMVKYLNSKGYTLKIVHKDVY